MPTFDSDTPLTVLGVQGRLTHRTAKPDSKSGLWFKQRWVSQARPVPGEFYASDTTICVEMRFDDEFGNGHNTFAITAEIRRPGRRDIEAGGCLFGEIAAAFPELEPLIRWHLCSTDGPMHYLANTVYLASDRDHWGLRKGETRQRKTRDGRAMWELVAVNSLGVAISPTGLEYQGAETVPLFILEKHWTGETPPATPKLEWRPSVQVGKGKLRELDAARRCARWPDAPDSILTGDPATLRAALEARLPALLTEFRADMERAGFQWAPPA